SETATTRTPPDIGPRHGGTAVPVGQEEETTESTGLDIAALGVTLLEGGRSIPTLGDFTTAPSPPTSPHPPTPPPPPTPPSPPPHSLRTPAATTASFRFALSIHATLLTLRCSVSRFRSSTMATTCLRRRSHRSWRNRALWLHPPSPLSSRRPSLARKPTQFAR